MNSPSTKGLLTQLNSAYCPWIVQGSISIAVSIRDEGAFILYSIIAKKQLNC